MRLARTLPLAAAVASAALVATAAPASAHLVDVKTATFSCPSDYVEVARAGSTVVCVHYLLPRWRVIVDGNDCPYGYSEYSVLDFYRVCVDLTH